MTEHHAPDDLTTRREQLIEAMSAVSEDRTCTGWASDWARTLHAEGGIWETLGRAVGWPTGNYDQWEWVSWEEAARSYGHETDAVSSTSPDQPTSGPTYGLSVQHADALWDAVAIPGPQTPTFPMQHERVCRAVAEILDEVAPAVPVVPVSSPPPDQAALRETVVAAIKASPFQELRAVGHAPNGPLQITIKVDDLADILTRRLAAVLPPPADGAAVLREAADGFDRHAEQILDGVGDKAVFVAKALRDQAAVWREAAETLRRLAAEAQQPDTETRPVARIINPQTGTGFGTGGNWPRKRLDATVDPAMCPRCKGDNSEAFQLCAACAGISNADPIVAYRSPGGHYLYCTRHTGELGESWTPVTSDDLPDGGLCGKCGVDVLIPQEGNQ